MQDRAREKVKWILGNHHVEPLDEDKQEELKATIREAEMEAG
jgi:trimethylamine:corrinoid methyltransferase-like protein